MRHLIISVVAILAVFFAAHAQAQVEISNAVYAGSGCLAGTAAIGLLQNSKIVALFDDYSINQAGGLGKKSSRKNCTMAVPVNVPKNMKIVVSEISVQNDVNLPRGSKSTFNAEVFFLGGKSAKATDVVKGSVNRVRIARKKLNVESDCGRDQILRVNTSLLVEAEAGRAALSGIRDKIELKLAFRRCQ